MVILTAMSLLFITSKAITQHSKGNLTHAENLIDGSCIPRFNKLDT